MRKLGLGFFLCSTAALAAQAPLAVTGLPDAAPLAIVALATPDMLVVELALAPEWHAYSRDVGGGQPISVRLAADCDFVASDALRFPSDVEGKLTGDVRLQLPITAQGEGTRLHAVIDLMVCDPLQCLPPMSVTISGEVRACRVLLVVDVADERSARIVAFLEEGGFEVEVSTYEEVTTAQCDRHDVVLADSKLFGKSRGTRQHVLKFPSTATPIVAVGFFGTELIEAHGIAMTSGYI